MFVFLPFFESTSFQGWNISNLENVWTSLDHESVHSHTGICKVLCYIHSDEHITWKVDNGPQDYFPSFQLIAKTKTMNLDPLGTFNLGE